MTTELAIVTGFAAAVACAAAMPVAIAIARRTDFYDRPRGYRKHAAPTPFLGGAAVLLAILVTALVVGDVAHRFWILLACAAALGLLGTLDDRYAVAPVWRLLAEVAAALALYAGGLGWELGRADGVQVALTVIWVVGIVNAFNLMDNLDGACATVACLCGIGIGVLAAIRSQTEIAGLAFALSGACACFLRYNLARPARIFLGDGGSMPIGLLVAGLAMALSRHLYFDGTSLLATALLIGLPILDTTLVTVSRLRRGVALYTGGRDHLTHRLLRRLGSPRNVAACLALLQLGLCGAAIAGEQIGGGALWAIAGTAVAGGVVAIIALDSAAWRPSGIAVGRQPLRSEAADAGDIHLDSARP
jgi:UDP-GlcNAc:undecaprenyl-phosphate GlcNAc-1-phosphate transferase